MIWSPTFTPKVELLRLLLKLHSIYSALLLLRRKSYASKTFSKSLTSHSIPLLTMQEGLHHLQKHTTRGANSWMCYVSTSKIKVKWQGLRIDPWCNHIVMRKSSVAPSCVLILVEVPPFISFIAIIYTILTPLFYRDFHKTSLDNLSYAFSKSMKTKCKSFSSVLYCSITRRSK